LPSGLGIENWRRRKSEGKPEEVGGTGKKGTLRTRRRREREIVVCFVVRPMPAKPCPERTGDAGGWEAKRGWGLGIEIKADSHPTRGGRGRIGIGKFNANGRKTGVHLVHRGGKKTPAILKAKGTEPWPPTEAMTSV